MAAAVLLSHFRRRYSEDMDLGGSIDGSTGRREAQARDVFDLCVLVPGTPDGVLLEFLAENLPVDHLEAAHDRALGIGHDEYRGQVIEFLEESELARQGTEDAWAEIRLRAAALIEAILDWRGRE